MARLVRRPRYEALARTLADENVEATPRQIERWNQAKWGAPDLMAPPEVLAAHYGDLIRLVCRGRPPAEVPLEMATLRHFTPGLPAAIHDLTAECAPDWKLSSDADLDTGRLMDQAADYPLLRRFVERFQRGSEKSGDPRPGTLSPGRLEANPLDKDKAAKARIKDRSQERTYGVVADMMDALARPGDLDQVLDIYDLHAVIGGAIDKESINLGNMFTVTALAGNPNALSEVVGSVSPTTLVAAVQAAEAMLPLAEALGTHSPRSQHERWQCIATLTPSALLFGALLGGTGAPTPEALSILAQLFDRPDRAEAYRAADNGAETEKTAL
jgi:hypothetical protein